MKRYCIFHILLAALLVINIQSLKAIIRPVIISETFYDSPLEEDGDAAIHHNGEFIELFNPTSEAIALGNWKIRDNQTVYNFPANTIIPERGLLIVAYQYPNSNFRLKDLFPSLNTIDPNESRILYQSNIILCNDGEEISLYDNNGKLVDKMSFKHKGNLKSYLTWNLSALNGSYKKKGAIPHLLSIQRNNIHFTSTSITPLETDYQTADATPLQTIVDIADYPTLTTIYDYNEINTGNEVGAMSGTASVTPTGASTYQMPIEVPAGTNGMQPSLSVVYNSQGGFGMLGQGWDVSGLSVISRGTQNFYYDAVDGKVTSTTIQFNTEDRLNIDGQRLVLLNSTENFTVGTEYGTEIENYSRVKVKNSSVTGKIYFELTTKEGNVVEYGNTANSIVTNASGASDGKILAWRINKITDVNGNVVEYKYSDYGQYPSKITYNNNEIDFTFETNDLNPKQRYISTFLTKQNKLLKSITTYQNSNKIKTYDFGYLYSDMDIRLDNISLKAADGKEINPTKIKWGSDKNIQKISLGEKMWDGNLNNLGTSHLYSGDIDGDGYADRIEMWEGSQSTSELGYIAVTLKGNKTLPLIRFPSLNQTYPHFHPSLSIGDINADGKDEIIVTLLNPLPISPLILYFRNLAITNSPYYYEADIVNGINVLGINSNNTKLINLQQITYSTDNSNEDILTPKWNTKEGYGYTPLLLNLNNDKYLDFVIVPCKYQEDYTDSDEKSEKYIVSYFYGSSTGLGSEQIKEKSYYMNGKGIVVGDFGANGRVEVREISTFNWRDYSININDNLTTGSYYPSDEIFEWLDNKINFEELYPVDIDGDGKTNILVRQGINGDKKWYNHVGWWKVNDLNIHNFSRTTHEREGDYAVPIDYNGDGLVDLIIGDDWRNNEYGKMDYEDYEKTYWYFYKNIGGKYVLEKTMGGSKYFSDDGTDYAGLSRMNPVVMDINGDGVQDLVFGDRQGDRDKRYYHAFTMPKANQRSVVQSITDGMGAEEKFTYTYFSDYNQEEQDVTDPVRNLKAPMMLVGTYTDALGSVTTYSYSNPKVHTEGKGFLGFETVSASNNVSKIKSTSIYEYDKTYYNVSLKHQETSTTDGKILSSVDITNKTVAASGKKRYMPLASDQTSVDYLKNITQKTTNVYNTDGTLQSQQVVTGNGAATTLTEYSNYKKRTSDGLVAYLPQTIKTTNKRTGGAKRHFKYYQNNLL